LPQSPSSRGL